MGKRWDTLKKYFSHFINSFRRIREFPEFADWWFANHCSSLVSLLSVFRGLHLKVLPKKKKNMRLIYSDKHLDFEGDLEQLLNTLKSILS